MEFKNCKNNGTAVQRIDSVYDCKVKRGACLNQVEYQKSVFCRIPLVDAIIERKSIAARYEEIKLKYRAAVNKLDHADPKYREMIEAADRQMRDDISNEFSRKNVDDGRG